MKIIFEAEVVAQKPAMETPTMYMSGHCVVNLKVVLAPGATGQVFEQQTILRIDEVQSTFDVLMKNLVRNMRETLVSYLEDQDQLKLPLMPVLKFVRMRP